MIKLFVWSLVVIVVALALSLTLGFPQDPGYLLIAFGNSAFETSLFALLVGACVAYACLRLLLLLLVSLNPWRLVIAGRRLKARRRAKAKSASMQGILSLVRGNWSDSIKQVSKGLKEDDASALNALAAAYASEQQGDVEAALTWLDQGVESFPEAETTIDTLRAEILLRADRLTECVAVLQKLRSNSPADTTLLRLLKRVYCELKDWPAIEALIPALRKHKAVSESQLAALANTVLLEKLSAAAAASDIAECQKLWKKTPASQREEPKLAIAYAEILLKLGEVEGGRRALEKALMKRWEAEAVLAYGALDFGLASKQLLTAEGWQRSRPNDYALLLTLARLSMRAQLWGKAKEYYASALRLESSAAALAEYAGLLRGLGQDAEADTATRGALAGTGLSLPMPTRDPR